MKPPQPPSDGEAGSLYSRREFMGQMVAGGSLLAMGLPALELDAAPAAPVLSKAETRTISISLSINGSSHTLDIDPRTTLLDVLREKLALPGTKKGYDHGQCGACTVLVDGRRINSCLRLAAMSQTVKIITIEGLANGDQLHPLQAAFIKHDAFQCGYCTPGQICSAGGLLREGHAHTDSEIRELMSGNICRCGAYQNIQAAVREVKDSHASV